MFRSWKTEMAEMTEKYAGMLETLRKEQKNALISVLFFNAYYLLIQLLAEHFYYILILY